QRFAVVGRRQRDRTELGPFASELQQPLRRAVGRPVLGEQELVVERERCQPFAELAERRPEQRCFIVHRNDDRDFWYGRAHGLGPHITSSAGSRIRRRRGGRSRARLPWTNRSTARNAPRS